MLYQLVWGGAPTYNQNLYTWFELGRHSAHVGFLADVDGDAATVVTVVRFGYHAAAEFPCGT